MFPKLSSCRENCRSRRNFKINSVAVNSVIASIAGLAGKAINAGVFYLVYIHTAEVFPTVARNSFLSICSVAGRLGSIISPYFTHLGNACKINLFVLSYASVAASYLNIARFLNWLH